MKLISVVTPCFNEVDNIPTCHGRIKEIFAKNLPYYQYEHIFCDNSSTDGTTELLKDLAKDDKNVKVIVNSRNFGPGPSCFNGILSASGDAVFVFVPADSQDPPELIPDFLKHWETGHQVVYGIRSTRKEGKLMTWLRKAYYRLASRLAGNRLLPDVGDFQLVDRSVVDALRRFDDYNPYLRGMIAHCGFQAIGIPYTWQERKLGQSKSTWYHLVDTGLNGILSFSKIPLRLCLLLGFLLSFGSIFWGVANLISGLLHYRKVAAPGIVTLIVGLFFLSGVQLFFLGILGEYLLAIHCQVRKKPNVVEKERINF